ASTMKPPPVTQQPPCVGGWELPQTSFFPVFWQLGVHEVCWLQLAGTPPSPNMLVDPPSAVPPGLSGLGAYGGLSGLVKVAPASGYGSLSDAPTADQSSE